MVIKNGVCRAIFAYDCAVSINLSECERRIAASKRAVIPHQRRAPAYFSFHSPPLRVVQHLDTQRFGDFVSEREVEITIYDFGAVQVAYKFGLNGPLDRLLALSDVLCDNAVLLAASKASVAELLEVIRDATSRPGVSDVVEDYLIFEVRSVEGFFGVQQVTGEHAAFIAQVLRSATQTLSSDETIDATSHHISYGTDDITIMDWNAAIVFDAQADDVIAVLEFANVELLEMRYLDQRLDYALEEAYQTLTQKKHRMPFLASGDADLDRIGELQVDSAILFEGVNNALKLLGDQYLARVYRLVSQRFHLAEWDVSILRKIETLESIYQKISTRVANRRMELVEWIIVVLFVVSIVLPFIVGH